MQATRFAGPALPDCHTRNRPAKPDLRKSLKSSGNQTRVRRAKISVLTALAVFIVTNLAFSIILDDIAPQLRDPEYGHREAKLKARLATNPSLVVVLGSSRTSTGVRPEMIDGTAVQNMSLVGSGPVTELLALRRLLHAGITPAAVLLEFWPPLLHGDGQDCDDARFDPHRYFASDRPFVREYCRHPEHTLAIMAEIREVPVWYHRARLMSQLLPSLQPQDVRQEGLWSRLDAGGWIPGFPSMPADRDARTARTIAQYAPVFARFRIDPAGVRAARETLSLCRDRGIRAAYVRLPESSEFRASYLPAITRLSDEYLAGLQRDFGVRFIDGREWLPDEMIGDGTHLTVPGATLFSHRLGRELATMFPQE